MGARPRRHGGSTEVLPAIYSAGRTAIQVNTRLNPAAEEPEDSVRVMRIGTEQMITNENIDVQSGLSKLLLARKSLEMLFPPLAQPGNRGYRFWPAQRTLRTKVGGLARDAGGRLPEFTEAKAIQSSVSHISKMDQ
jgi:hypothetical protein